MGVSGGGERQSGNVWEWCRDCYDEWYDENYYGASGVQRNPTGLQKGSHRVYRGGCWKSNDASCFRAAYRGRYVPAIRRDHYRGFRLVRAA